jgi:hypothetical protein
MHEEMQRSRFLFFIDSPKEEQELNCIYTITFASTP